MSHEPVDLEDAEALFTYVREKPWTDAMGHQVKEQQDALIAEVRALRLALAPFAAIHARIASGESRYAIRPDATFRICWSGSEPVELRLSDCKRAKDLLP